ncbi:DUF1573 domain-containing protein [Fibrivirga algicola]|uniref:DUF1573 domain-containing protein n=1 Tax=Fibrivirga algicola TaxID=2950420 RepID=A0ABX0QGA5_9BACT|nr:DUF1573 domain-containing protein [Fibrivirga algicola]ARK11929.1 hypothetical protein A6C57_17220 [Fibrella sp. ES10-3-2-2]NID11254.1 DUF1573 domain-containing protein [Fibrivirga algicola]
MTYSFSRIGLLAAVLVGLLGQTSCTNRRDANGQPVGEQNAVAGKSAKIEFLEKGVHDFGQITEGDTVEYLYKFVNKGELPLMINNITASCGCTTPDWPRDPVAPGQESAVRVRFNSRGKQGEQRKSVSIYANTEPAMTNVEFKVLVNPKPDSTKKTN